VWASAWNDRAFEERVAFGLDPQSIYAGVLIQVGVQADAAGVLVTRNLYTGETDRQYTISAQRGLGIRVVEGRTVPEQLVYNLGTDGIKVISRSDDPTMLVLANDGGIEELPNPAPG